MTSRAVTPLPLIWSRDYSGRADQVREARKFLAGALENHPAASDAVLCLSELAANAVLHSASGQPGGRFTVRVRLGQGGRLRVEVADDGGPWAVPAGTGGQHGRGLLIVSRLALNWGISGDDCTGRIAWFEY